MSSKSVSSVAHEGGAGFDTTTIQPSTELTPPMHEPMEPHLHIEHLDGLVDGGHDHDSELYTHRTNKLLIKIDVLELAVKCVN